MLIRLGTGIFEKDWLKNQEKMAKNYTVGIGIEDGLVIKRFESRSRMIEGKNFLQKLSFEMNEFGKP